MKRTLSTAALTIVATSIMVATVSAGERAGAFSISPFAGGYTFDGAQHLKTEPVYGLRLGYDLTKYLGVEAVGNYVATEGTNNGRSENALSYRMDLLFNLIPDGPLVPYLAAGGGGITMGHGSSFSASDNNSLGYTGGKNTAATANVGMGLKYFMTDSVALRADARQLFIFGHKALYNWEYTAGLTFLIGGQKAPAPAAAIPAEVPAAAPVPTSNLSVTPGAIIKGEPATLSWTSQDATNCEINQGIGPVSLQGSMAITPAAETTYSLSCSGPGGTTNSTANIAVTASAPTSSLSVTPDSIIKGESSTLNWKSDNATSCDIQPNIGPVQPQGSLPVTPATDTAYTLTCTGAGGTTTSEADIKVTSPATKQERTCIVLHIEFDTGKADIKPKYHDEVAKVADFMQKYPEARGVIEGHTDTVGGKAYNMKLSQRRADSVKNYLFEKFNIAHDRLTSTGYGFSKPIATNKTKEGRQKNRRIQATFDCIIIVK